MPRSTKETPVHSATNTARPRAREWHRVLRRDGWSILTALGARVSRDNVFLLSAGIAFYIFVGIPSGLAAIIAIYGLMLDPAQVENQIASLIGVLPADVITVLGNFLHMLSARERTTLSLHLVFGLAIALWSAQAAASSMIVALDTAYERPEPRTFLRFEIAALLLAGSSIVFGFLSLLLFAAAPIVLARVMPPGNPTATAISTFRWPALALIVALAIAGIYRFVPARKEAWHPWGIWGVILTTIVWLGTSALFALYVAKVASYDVSYGFLGAVVVLLLWLYIATFVVLLGAELNAELEKRMAAEYAREQRMENGSRPN